MTEVEEKVSIHVNIEISAEALETIVAQAKAAAGPDTKGIYRIDTADVVSDLISNFLDEMDFLAYVRDPQRYGRKS